MKKFTRDDIGDVYGFGLPVFSYRVQSLIPAMSKALTTFVIERELQLGTLLNEILDYFVKRRVKPL